MPAERYYLDTPLVLDEELFLKEKEFHHLAHVMRTKIGQTIELVNGQGVLAKASVITISRDQAKLKIIDLWSSKNGSSIILAQAMTRFNHLEWILEKGTELGATEFWLFPGKLSEKKDFSAHQLDRMKEIAISAMKQCGRLDLPKMEIKPALSFWQKPMGTLFYGDTSPNAPPLLKKTWKKEQPVIFFVGPEKGFHPHEIAHLIELGAKGVSLHPNTLRAETAPLVALTLLNNSLA